MSYFGRAYFPVSYFPPSYFGGGEDSTPTPPSDDGSPPLGAAHLSREGAPATVVVISRRMKGQSS